MCREWWQRAVFYQIYPRSFKDSNGDGIGDLPGIISKLDYLNDGTPHSLGVDAIWLSPVYPSPQHDFGYDVSDYCAIDPDYGTMEDFDLLLREAHRRGIRVIMDLVANHTSDQHPWFIESRSSRDNPKRGWYIWHDGCGPRNRPPNNWRNHFFGSAWQWEEKTGQYYLHSFLRQQPDLNWSNPQVRRAIFEAIKFWLARGVDGFRLDVAHLYAKDEHLRDNPTFFRKERVSEGQPFIDRSLTANIYRLFGFPELQVKKYNQHQPETHRILKEFRKLLDSYPGKTSVGEIISGDPRQVMAYYGENNDQLHLNFYFDLLDCRFSAAAFCRAIERWERLLPKGSWPAYTLSNHDRVRAISRYGRGETGDRRARLLALMLLTLKGTPFIYYGEEIGMRESRIPRHRLKDPVGTRWYPLYRGRDGARTPMQWENFPGAGFTEGESWLPVGPQLEKRNVSVQDSDPDSLLNFYRQLIWLRKNTAALTSGRFNLLTGVQERCFFYQREAGDQRVLVALNFSGSAQKIPLRITGEYCRMLLSTVPDRRGEGIPAPFIMEPYEGCVLQ